MSDIVTSAETLTGRAPLDRALRLFAGSSGWAIATFVVAGLVSLPVLVVLSHVFVDTGEIWSHLASTVLPRYMANSLWMMLGVGFGVAIGGVGAAWLVTMCRFRGSRVLEWALLLPLAMPAYVIAYTYTGFLDYAGPVQSGLRVLFGWQSARDYWFPEIRSLGGAISMMSLVLYPYVYMLTRAAFLEQSVCVLEASRTLGSSPYRAFRSVALPLARPAVAGGVALALMETLNDLGTVQFFAVDTFTTGIFRTWIGMGEPAAAAQLGAVLMLFIFALVMIERFSRGRARYHHTTGRYRSLPQFHLRGWRAVLAQAFCAMPVVFGFALPVALLVNWSVMTAPDMVDARFIDRSLNSFTLAAIAALLAVAVAMLLAYGQRMNRSKAVAGAVRLSSLGYAVPGAVIAVGTLMPFGFLDNAVDSWLREAFGISSGLLLTGSIAALIFAYLVRFLAVSLNTVEASLAKVTYSMECASRTLGQGPLGTLRRVHLPIMQGSILTAGLLVFVDVMKELPATLIMRPFNFDTLAVRAYELAADERLADAAPSALVIVVVGILPVILLSRVIAKSRPGEGKSGR